jgi:hypothetical protein
MVLATSSANPVITAHVPVIIHAVPVLVMADPATAPAMVTRRAAAIAQAPALVIVQDRVGTDLAQAIPVVALVAADMVVAKAVTAVKATVVLGAVAGDKVARRLMC